MSHENLPPGRLIGIISNMIRRVMDKKFSDSPYSPGEMACIGFISDSIRENPEIMIFQRDIEKEFNLRSPSASELIKNMEKKGLLRREGINGDGRKKKIILTDKAIECDSESKTKIKEMEQLLSNNISSEDMETYCRVSKQIIDNLRMEELNG